MLDLKEDGLPDGYFTSGDIEAYRKLVAQVPDGGTVVEVGVWKGRSLCAIAPECKRRGIKLFAVDPYIGLDDVYATLIDNLDHFGIECRQAKDVNILRYHSVAASSMFDNASLDLVFLDGPHDRANVAQDIALWLPKVKPGGVLAGHDFNAQWSGVGMAVTDRFGQRDFRIEAKDVVWVGNPSTSCWMQRVGGINIAPPVYERDAAGYAVNERLPDEPGYAVMD